MKYTFCSLLNDLKKAGKISEKTWFEWFILEPERQIALTQLLEKERIISFSQYLDVSAAITRERETQSKEKATAEKAQSKKKLREIDSLYGRPGSPIAQGGLPSLGKKP